MSDRYLLLDGSRIDRAENAVLRVWPANKHAQNPLFGEDRPWEQRFDNLYPNIMFDEEESLYKLLV